MSEEQKLVKNPQMVQMSCMPILGSFLNGHQKFTELPTSMQNLINRCTQEIEESLNIIPLVDVDTIGKTPTAPKKPCAGCQ